MNKNKVVLMAFAKGSESVEGGNFKRFTGVGICNVVAVNPNKDELEKLYGTVLDKDPEYVGKDPDGKQQVRLDFIVKTVPEKNNGLEATSKVSFFLKNEPRYNGDKTKMQIIDKYGMTAWATVEEVKNHSIPQYKNGPADIDAGYRPAYGGEEDLVGFLKCYLNIPSKSWFDPKTSERHVIKDLSLAEAQLDDIKKYFTGDVKELRTIVALQPENKIKIGFGIKTTDEGKEYQDVFTRMFLRAGAKDNARLAKAIEDAQAAGSYPKTVFTTGALKEYSVEASTFDSGMPETPPAPTAEDWFGNNA